MQKLTELWVQNRRPIAILSILALGAIVMLAVMYATAWGPGGYSDSAAYLVAARNLRDGRGLTIPRADGRWLPLPLRPPFYPIAITLFSLPGFHEFDAARGLDALLFGGLVTLVGLLVYRLSESPFYGITASLLILASPLLMDAATMVMSEILFILLSLVGLAFLLMYWERNTWGALLGAGIVVGLAVLTRFIGASLVVVGTLLVLFTTQGSTRSKFLRTGIFILCSIVPVLIWLLIVRLGGGTSGVYAWDLSDPWGAAQPYLTAVVRSYWNWIPLSYFIKAGGIPLHTLLVVAFWIFAIGLLAWLWWTNRIQLQDPSTGRVWRSILVLMLFSAAYLAVLAWTYLFVELPKPALYDRLFLPTILIAVAIPLLLTLLVARTQPRLSWLQIPILALLAIYIVQTGREAAWLARHYHANGHGFFAPSYLHSETIAAVDEIPLSTPLISNDFALVLLFTNRPTYNIPEIQNGEAKTEFTRFGESGDTPEEQLFRDGLAILVVFDSLIDQFEEIYGGRADARMEAFLAGLDLVQDTADGAIYRAPTNR